jgi:hypothetical protein
MPTSLREQVRPFRGLRRSRRGSRITPRELSWLGQVLPGVSVMQQEPAFAIAPRSVQERAYISGVAAHILDIELDYNGGYEFRRDGKLVAELIWCENPTDRTRFGWLLHIVGASEDDVIAVFRVGAQTLQEALWAKRALVHQWHADAEATRGAVEASALREANDTLSAFALNSLD